MKSIRKTIRFSNDEWESIDFKIKLLGVDFSTFSRAIILEKNITLPIERELLYQINKIGNNLNQIAKAVNSRSDRISILTQLVEIEKALKEIK